MKNTLLYHGTWEDSYKRILEEKIIKNHNIDISEPTKIINECLNSYGDKVNLRDNAIFLSNDVAGMEIFDYAFVVNSKDLDVKKLYVANATISQEIYLSVMTKKPEKLIKKLVQNYENSLIKFKEFLRKENSIDFPEFLYLENISLDIAKVVDSNFVIDAVFEEYA